MTTIKANMRLKWWQTFFHLDYSSDFHYDISLSDLCWGILSGSNSRGLQCNNTPFQSKSNTFKTQFVFCSISCAPIYTHIYSLPALEGYYAKHQSLKDWLHAEAGSLFMQLSCHNKNCSHQIEFKHQLATFVKAFWFICHTWPHLSV